MDFASLSPLWLQAQGSQRVLAMAKIWTSQQSSTEGGTITLSGDSPRAMVTGATVFGLQNAYSDYTTRLSTQGPASLGTWQYLYDPVRDGQAGKSSDAVVDLSNYNSVPGGSSFNEIGHYVVDGSPLHSAVDATTTPASSPILRIPGPIFAASGEGGAIDLTAMASATSSPGARAPNSAAFARAAERATLTPTDSSGVSARQASSIEGTRARAVVFEVATTAGRGDSDEDQSLNLDPRASKQRGEGSRAAKPQVPSEPKLRGAAAMAPRSAKTEKAEMQSGDAIVATAATSEAGPATSESNSANRDAASDNAAAHDAAFTDWNDGDDSHASTEASAATSFAATRRQKLGLALAAVVGISPLVKRARRSNNQPSDERPGGLPS
jgi:hypothetical protein